jgi:opacity protein-like surface antigen
MKKVMLTVASVGLMAGSASAADLYSQGLDGSNGYSNGTVGAFGSRRTVLDDFTVPAGETWTLQDFHWQHIWNTFPAGSGAGVDLSFRSDAGGAPGAPVATANITSYSEMGTGVTYFSRPGAESWVTFDDIVLGPGTYWFEAAIQGPENNFWLITSTVSGSRSSAR